jgi:hypothetical protein
VQGLPQARIHGLFDGGNLCGKGLCGLADIESVPRQQNRGFGAWTRAKRRIYKALRRQLRVSRCVPNPYLRCYILMTSKTTFAQWRSSYPSRSRLPHLSISGMKSGDFAVGYSTSPDWRLPAFVRAAGPLASVKRRGPQLLNSYKSAADSRSFAVDSIFDPRPRPARRADAAPHGSKSRAQSDCSRLKRWVRCTCYLGIGV